MNDKDKWCIKFRCSASCNSEHVLYPIPILHLMNDKNRMTWYCWYCFSNAALAFCIIYLFLYLQCEKKKKNYVQSSAEKNRSLHQWCKYKISLNIKFQPDIFPDTNDIRLSCRIRRCRIISDTGYFSDIQCILIIYDS